VKALKNLKIIIISLAVALFATVIMVYLLEEQLSIPFQIALHAAIYLTIIYLIVNVNRIIRSFKRKVVRETTGLILIIPVIFGILTFVYLIADAYKARFDVTVGHKFTLSDQTIKIVENMDIDITILCFYNDAQAGREYLKAGLDQYRYYSKKISYEFIDPDKYPQRAKQYGIENYGEVIFVSERQREKVKQIQDEQDITNGILKVLSKERKAVYFIAGHGEPGVENMQRTGYGLLKRQLELENYAVQEISLMRTPELPADTSCLVLAAPTTDLFDEEMAIILDYLFKQGGSLLVLSDFEVPQTIREFLDLLGVELGDNMIIDKMSQLFGANYEVAVIGQYEKHPITEGFSIASFLPASSSVRLKDSLPEGLEGQYLAFSGAGSWAETNLELLRTEGKATLDEDDKQGPIPVGVALTKTFEKEGAKEGEVNIAEAKIVVYGDSDFVSNTHLRLSGNRDLFLNSIAWLSGEESLIAIRGKEVDATPLFLRKGQSRMLFFVTVIIMPLLVIAIGVVMLIRRRKV